MESNDKIYSNKLQRANYIAFKANIFLMFKIIILIRLIL